MDEYFGIIDPDLNWTDMDLILDPVFRVGLYMNPFQLELSTGIKFLFKDLIQYDPIFYYIKFGSNIRI